MNKNDVKMAACIGVAVIAVALSLMWARTERRIAGECREKSAHLQMQLDSYEQLMADREERIHELEKEIAADKN